MEFTVLGPVQVRHNGQELRLRPGLELSLLVVLLFDHDEVVPLDRVIGLVWGTTPPATVRAQIHNMVSRLRHCFAASKAAASIVTHPNGYQLRLGRHELDLTRFRNLVAGARQACGDRSFGLAADRYDDALALWQGPALADVVEPLATALRPGLREEWFAAVEERLDAELANGRYDKVLAEVAGLLREHPLREHLYRRKMLALHGAGRRADALVTFQEAYRRLVDELGVEPGQALRDLQRQILHGEPVQTLGVPSAARGPDVVTLALPTPRELPTATDRFVGRDTLLDEVLDLLRDEQPAVPPVAVLAGQGGVGKTTIAVHVGHQLSSRFPDGQLYAELSGVRQPADPYQVLGRMLRALGVAGHQVPDQPEDQVARYRSRLAGRRLLVVLDDAYDENQVRPLLPAVPGCAAIVTSRRRLDALDATTWTVPVLSGAEAARLFGRVVGAERLAAEPDAARAVADACGGLPLAVRIAAARVAARRDWAIADFASRLTAERGRLDELVVGDLDVRASIGLSYQALDPELRHLLQGVGRIRVGSWPGWVAATLADVPIATGRRLLDRLVDVHLVEPLGRDEIGQTRFRLHDLVREYVEEQSRDGSPQLNSAVDRTLAAWSGLAARADESLEHGMGLTVGMSRPEPPPGLPADLVSAQPRLWFEIERQSLVTGVAQAVARGRVDLAYELALFTYGFLGLRQYEDDRESMLRQAIRCAEAAGREELLPRLLGALFGVYAARERLDELPAVADRIVESGRRLGDQMGEMRGRLQAAFAAFRRGYVRQSERLWRDALARCEREGADPHLTEGARGGLAGCALELGRYDTAIDLYTRVMEYEQGRGVTRRTAIYLRRYAQAELANGNPDRAEELLREGLEITERIGDDIGSAHFTMSLGTVDVARGRWREAEQRLAQAYARLDERGNPGTAEALFDMADLELTRGRFDVARRHLALALTQFRRHGARLEIARTLARLATAHDELNDPGAAWDCLSECQALMRELELDQTSLRLPPRPAAT